MWIKNSTKTWHTWQFKYLWNASVIWQSGIRFICLLMTTSSWSYLVLKIVANTWRLPPDSVMFLSLHIIFWYCNMKRQKPLIKKNACKMKNIWLVCKKLQYSINFYSFSTTFMKFICIFENGSLVSLFWEWPIYMTKNCGKSICKPLQLIFNQCINIGSSPLEWKKANVAPIHKNGDKECLKNYWPVSQLPIC